MSRAWDGMIEAREGIYKGRRYCPYCAFFDTHAAGCRMRSLLAVARAAKRMCSFSIPPRTGEYSGLPGEEARRATFRALARLKKAGAR